MVPTIKKEVFSPKNFNFDAREFNSTSIYYTPHFEFAETNFDNPDYIDVSSDFLFHESSLLKEEDIKILSPAVHFRREEIKRQIAFVQFADAKAAGLQFYEEFIHNLLTISFNQYFKALTSPPRYINYEDYEIYKVLDRSFLNHEAKLKNRISKAIDSENNSIELGKLWFLKRVIEILFYTAEFGPETKYSNNREIKIQEKDISLYKNAFVLRNFTNFIDWQVFFTDNDGAKFKSQINKVLALIESDFKYNKNDKAFTIGLELAKELLVIELEIFDLFPHKTNMSLFSFDWPNLSTGEKAYLNLFARINEGYLRMQQHNNLHKSSFIYFLIDEPSTGFHPQWQKEYLKKVYMFLFIRVKQYKQLIIATHSPYLTSDIQIEDVISINGENNSRFRVENTFAANIHDLLADSFYLQNGFMGDIAKDYIEEIANELNKESLSKNRVEALKKRISIIGEPILKERLLYMLMEKNGEKSKDEIIAELKEENERLRNGK